MYINFQHNRVNRSVLTVYINLFAKNRKLHNFQLPIVIFKNQLLQTCVILQRTCILIFSKIGLVDQLNPCSQIYFQKNTNCVNLQLVIRISKNHGFQTCTTP